MLKRLYARLRKLPELLRARLESGPETDPAFLEQYSDLAELEQRPAPTRIMRATMYAVICFVLAATAWSALARVDRVVAAEGKLVHASPTIIVQPLEISIIRSFEVEVGQVVRAGQVLVRLDPTFSAADESRLKAKEGSVLLQIERFDAELRQGDFAPGPGYDRAEARVQTDLFIGRRNEYAHKVNAYDLSVDELGLGIASLREQHEESKRQLAILIQVEEIYKQLYEQKIESLVSYLNAKLQKTAKISEIARLKNEIEEKTQSVSRVRAEKNAFISNWNNYILSELTRLKTEYDAIREDLSKAAKLHELTELVAPEAGVVLELGPFSVGSVATAGTAVMTLVPLNAAVEAEILIDPAEIGYVRLGDPCRLKLSTFPFQKHGTLDGELRTVSSDSLRADASEEPKFKARVRLTGTKLSNVPDDFRLVPGMSLRAEVKIGTRRVISFFIYPLVRTLDEALREP
jgi:HlyD family secretion protein